MTGWLSAPKYYRDFKCIADKCKHTCCVGWEIDVDEQTLKKYSLSNKPYKDVVMNSIVDDSPSHFLLDENERCPHLDDKGLCRIITEFGEEYLCDICREHPRFYNRGLGGMEVGIGIACEEAARIVLSSDGYDEFVKIKEIDLPFQPVFIDYYSLRTGLYDILSDREINYQDRLKMIYEEYGVSPRELSDKDWRFALMHLEYLEQDHKTLFSSYTSELNTNPACEKMLERALAYFVYRHCGAAESEEEFKLSLRFSLFLERLLSAISTPETIIDCARIISEEIEYSEDNTDALKYEF